MSTRQHYETVDYNDPLSLLLAAEDADEEVDARHAQFDAGLYRAKSFEREKTEGDTFGWSPGEIDHLNATEH